MSPAVCCCDEQFVWVVAGAELVSVAELLVLVVGHRRLPGGLLGVAVVLDKSVSAPPLCVNMLEAPPPLKINVE